MKHTFLIFAFVFFALTSFAQCTSCTISITGNDAADHVVTIGEVLCIQPSGHATGRFYVTSGGILCNQGHINSTNIYVSGGGEFDNYGVAAIDTFFISNPSAVFNNYDSITINVSGASSNAVLTNNGTMSCFSYWDTAATFVNNGRFHVTQNIYLGPNARFINNQLLSIGGNFGNGPGSSFTTNCMVPVGVDWYNAGKINGPVSGCGGFNIAGQSYNVSIVGDTGHIDLCDAGHPAGGIDGNSGTMTGVTFCQCQNVCTSMVSIAQIPATDISFNIFPNPASDKLQINFADETEATITMQNILGSIVQSPMLSKGAKEMTLSTSSLESGLYILTIEANGIRTSHKIEIVR